jgi:hypothetical protein
VDLRTSKRLLALLAAEIELAAKRIMMRSSNAEIEEILHHIELQVLFIREVSYRSRTITAPLREIRSAMPDDSHQSVA